MSASPQDRKSNSPILFARISSQYLQAAEIIWKAEFEEKNPFHWDKAIILRPLSHLLGISLETALKGLSVCRGVAPPRTHDLCKLLKDLNDKNLEAKIAEGLKGIVCPKSFIDVNPDRDVSELQAIYRRHDFHFHQINQTYDKPYATRYPILGLHGLPDAQALMIIIKVLLDVLNIEQQSWRREESS